MAGQGCSQGAGQTKHPLLNEFFAKFNPILVKFNHKFVKFSGWPGHSQGEGQTEILTLIFLKILGWLRGRPKGIAPNGNYRKI